MLRELFGEFFVKKEECLFFEWRVNAKNLPNVFSTQNFAVTFSNKDVIIKRFIFFEFSFHDDRVKNTHLNLSTWTDIQNGISRRWDKFRDPEFLLLSPTTSIISTHRETFGKKNIQDGDVIFLEYNPRIAIVESGMEGKKERKINEHRVTGIGRREHFYLQLISVSVIFIFRGRPRAFTSNNGGLEFHNSFPLMFRTAKTSNNDEICGRRRTDERGRLLNTCSPDMRSGAVKRDDKKSQRRGGWTLGPPAIFEERRLWKEASYRNTREQKVGGGNCIFRLMRCVTPPFCRCSPKDFSSASLGDRSPPTW